MRKFLLTLSLVTLVFTAGTQIARADSVMLSDGSVVKGKISSVLAGMVEVKTDRGTKKLFREVSAGEARDIIEYGFVLKKRIMGEVYLVNNSTIEMATSSGNLSMNRLWVRDIILSQQLPLESAPSH